MATSWGWVYSRFERGRTTQGQHRLRFLPRHPDQPHQSHLGHRSSTSAPAPHSSPHPATFLQSQMSSTPLLGLDLVRSDQVVVTEGPFDWLTAVQWGLAAVALLGTRVSCSTVQALARFRRVCLALGSDEAGQRAAAQLAGELTGQALIVDLPAGVHDVNDLGRLPGGREAFLRRIQVAARGSHSLARSEWRLPWRETTIPMKAMPPSKKKPPKRLASTAPGVEMVSILPSPPSQQTLQSDTPPTEPYQEWGQPSPRHRSLGRRLDSTVASVTAVDAPGYKFHPLLRREVRGYYLSYQAH
jgi:hypothetical protein